MYRIKYLSILFLLFIIPIVIADGTYVDENFDDGNHNGWTDSGSYYSTSTDQQHSGTHSEFYDANAGTTTYLTYDTAINLNGVNSATATFWGYSDADNDVDDYCCIGIYNGTWDDGTVDTDECIDGGGGDPDTTWTQLTHTFDAGQLVANVQIRMVCNGDNKDDFYIDDINVTYTGDVTPSNAAPTLDAYNTAPNSPTVFQNITFNLTCSDTDGGDTITGCVLLFNNSVQYGNRYCSVVSSGINTMLHELNSSFTLDRESWTGGYNCTDGTDFSSKENDTSTIPDRCETECQINTNYYNMTLKEGIGYNYIYHKNSDYVWTRTSAGDGDGENLMEIYAGAWVLTQSVNSECNTTIIDSTTINVYCDNANAQNNWTFYDSYIKIRSRATNADYRIYYYVNGSHEQRGIYIWNGTHKTGADGWQTWLSSTGITAFSLPYDFQNSTLIFDFDENVKTSFDYTNDSAADWASIAYGRSSQITQNTWMETYIKAINRSECDGITGDQRYTDVFTNFTNDRTFGDNGQECPGINSCSCPTINTNWEIDMADQCSIETDCNIGTGQITYTGTGFVNFDAVINSSYRALPTANQIVYYNSTCLITAAGDIS